MTVIVIVIFAAWFAFSVVGQVDSKILSKLKNCDHFSLIPRWTFFAPRPGTTDYHLVFQFSNDGTEWPWQEMSLADRRTLWGALWNPHKRNKKALCDTVHSLGKLTRTLEEARLWQMQYSVPYIATLKYLSGWQHPQSASHIRFMILESDGFYPEWEPRLLLLSGKHRLD